MKSQRYMIDTHTSGNIIKNSSAALRKRLRSVPMASLCISALTAAELLDGVVKKPEVEYLPVAVKEFLLRVEIMPWDFDAAQAYVQLQSVCAKENKVLGAMDMLIAAHSIAVGTVLITHDKSFHNIVHHLTLEDWTQAVRE